MRTADLCIRVIGKTEALMVGERNITIMVSSNMRATGYARSSKEMDRNITKMESLRAMGFGRMEGFVREKNTTETDSYNKTSFFVAILCVRESTMKTEP
jgi:hypothetical protein